MENRSRYNLRPRNTDQATTNSAVSSGADREPFVPDTVHSAISYLNTLQSKMSQSANELTNRAQFASAPVSVAQVHDSDLSDALNPKNVLVSGTAVGTNEQRDSAADSAQAGALVDSVAVGAVRSISSMQPTCFNKIPLELGAQKNRLRATFSAEVSQTEKRQLRMTEPDRPSSNSLSRMEIGATTAGQSWMPLAEETITPPGSSLTTGKQQECRAVHALLDETVFLKTSNALCSTPTVGVDCLKLQELKTAANILGPIVEEAYGVNTGPLISMKFDLVRTNLLREYPNFWRHLQICRGSSNAFNSQPSLGWRMFDLCNRAQQALEQFGFEVRGDNIAKQRKPVPEVDITSRDGSVASRESSSSQAKVNLICQRAKQRAEMSINEEKKSVLEEMREIQKRKVDMDYQEKLLEARADELKLQAESRANEMALADLEAYESGMSVAPPKSLQNLFNYSGGMTGADRGNFSEQCSNLVDPVVPGLPLNSENLYNRDRQIPCSKLPQEDAHKFTVNRDFDRSVAVEAPVPHGDNINNFKWIPTDSSADATYGSTKKRVHWTDAANDDSTCDYNEQQYSTPLRSRPDCTATTKPSTMMLQLDGLSDLLKQSRIPHGEPPIFDGSNLEEFLPFRSSFMALISENCYSDEQRYRFLLKYTGGDAKGLVHSCHMTDIGAAYREAMKQLHARYGDPFKLAQHFLSRLHQWPAIREGNADDLMDMSLFLNRVRNMMQRGEEWMQLDSARELGDLASKLPFRLRRLWAEKVCSMQISGRMAKFCDLVDIVKHEADILACPGMSDLLHHRGTGALKSNSRHGSKMLPTTTAEICEDSDASTSVPKPASSSLLPNAKSTQTDERVANKASYNECIYCLRTGHTIAQCRSFYSRSFPNRKSWLEANRLCFRCLGKSHFANKCRVSVKCLECNSSEHTRAMHRSAGELEIPSSGANAVALAVNHSIHRIRPKVWSPLVAVEIISPNGMSCYTYAALDTWASSSFVSKEVAEMLQESGIPSPLNVTTVTESCLKLDCSKISGLSIRGLSSIESYPLSSLFKISHWPFDKGDLPSETDWYKFPHLRSVPCNFIDANVGLLLGQADSDLLKVLETVSGLDNEPYATRHKLGWAIQGCATAAADTKQHCLKTSVSIVEDPLGLTQLHETNICRDLEALYRAEFDDPTPNLKGGSSEDQLWEERVKSSICKKNGKLQIDLPFRDPNVQMLNNRKQALNCVKHLQRRLSKDPELQKDYTDFMQKMVINGHLELVPRSEIEGVPGRVWFLVHHPVRHKVKKKLRVVFDCSRKYGGVSLNDVLLQGPDLLNRLIGVLIRFREHPIAFTGDIEQMFFQLKVPPSHADFMRIYWWPEGKLKGEPLQYRLTCHTFGAISSPSIANFAVKEAAKLAESRSCEAGDALATGAYMDDILCSTSSVESAKLVLSVVRQAASAVGFNVRGVLSNSRDLLTSLPEEILSSQCKTLNICRDGLPSDRVLGVVWQMHNDSFSYRLNPPCLPDLTSKRSLLASLSSLFDPLGLVVPVIIPMRSLFQRVCVLGIGWDDFLPREIEAEWSRWLNEICCLSKIQIPRCFGGPSQLEKEIQLHIFCDGSELAYAAAAYSRIITKGEIECALLMAKVRQVPITKGAFTTIPRIELSAAKLAINLGVQVRRELSFEVKAVHYWSDSTIVLHYIRSKKNRFQRFVANRVDFILHHSCATDWHFVPGKLNVSDIASRGCTASKLLNRGEWFSGPPFLKEHALPCFEEPKIQNYDLEIKDKSLAVSTKEPDNVAEKLLDSTSSWNILIRRIFIFLSFVRFLKSHKREVQRYPHPGLPLIEIEVKVWEMVQRRNFEDQINTLKKGSSLQKQDKLARLSPVMQDGLICVDSRVKLEHQNHYPIVLTCEDHAVRIYIQHLHVTWKHAGRLQLTALLHERFHILGLNRFIKNLLSSCISCIRVNGRPTSPIMDPLPPARTMAAPRPFTDTGIDFFGPILATQGRRSIKTYGVIFTCLACRAVHIELALSLDISSFISALRRFTSRRGVPKTIYSDQGTNLVGAQRALKEELGRIDQQQIRKFAFQEEINWVFSPPKASHFGGTWERMIRSVRRILMTTLNERKRNLNTEELETLFCEAEFILNARPLTPVAAESTDMGPITPNHLLLGTCSPAQALSDSTSNLAFTRQRWKHVQSLADTFWQRWRKEYLPTLRLRPKWLKSQRNFEEGDLVLVVDGDVPRGSWPTALVNKVYPSKDGVVRKVSLRVVRSGCGSRNLPGVSTLDRPVHKLVLVSRWTDVHSE